MGRISSFSLVPKFSSRHVLCAIWGTSRPVCTPSGGGGRVLLRCCRPSVGSSRPFVSRGSEKLVFVENVCELRSSAKKTAFFDSRGGLWKHPASDGHAPKLEVCRNFPPAKIVPAETVPSRTPPPPMPPAHSSDPQS